MGDIYQKAIDSKQYDNDDLIGWGKENNGIENPIPSFFWEYLKLNISDLAGKNILDIGSGSGWLLNLAYEAGADAIIGIDPSQRNVQHAKKHYPYVITINTTLENFSSDTTFDYIFSVMSLVHIADVEKAFQKIGKLLKTNGHFFAIVPDYDFYRKQRYGYEVFIEDINKEEYATLVKRPWGALADIIRKIDKYTKAAKNANLSLVEDISMKPTESLIVKVPRYKQVQASTLSHLLHFTKQK